MISWNDSMFVNYYFLKTLFLIEGQLFYSIYLFLPYINMNQAQGIY